MLYNKYDMFFPGKFYFAKVVKIRQKTTTFALKSAFKHLVYILATSNTSRYDYNWLLYLSSFSKIQLSVNQIHKHPNPLYLFIFLLYCATFVDFLS